MIANILNQEPGQLDQIQKGSGEKDALGRMVAVALRGIWQGILDDKLYQGDPLVQTRLEGDGTDRVTYVESGNRVALKFSETNLGEKATEVCNWVVNNLCKGHKQGMVHLLDDAVHKMERTSGELERALDPLILRPLILRTRCDLCPV